MALYGLVCNCGGSEGLVRRCFKRAGVKDWLSIPVYKGKENISGFLSNFDNPSKEIMEVANYAKNTNPYAVVVGVDGEVKWVDVKHGGMKEMLDAELIAEQFA